MVSNVTVNGKQLGGKCLKDSGCFIAISLKSISCFPFTTFKAMNQPRLHLSGAQHRGKLHTVYIPRCFAFCLKASTQEKNQNSSLSRGRGQSLSWRLHAGLYKAPFIVLWALQQALQVWEGGSEMQKTSVRNAQLKSPFILGEIVPPGGVFKLCSFYFIMLYFFQM